MPSTLEEDLRSVAMLYAWASIRLGLNLDSHFTSGGTLTGGQMQSFLTDLRSCPSKRLLGFPTLTTTARRAAAVRLFLGWVIDPGNQGSSRPVRLEELQMYRQTLQEVFRPFTQCCGTSGRRRPLTDAEAEKVFELVGPERDRDGYLQIPLRFRKENPTQPRNCGTG